MTNTDTTPTTWVVRWERHGYYSYPALMCLRYFQTQDEAHAYAANLRERHAERGQEVQGLVVGALYAI